MALKPLFYMLAQHGPWSYHVRVKNLEVMNEVEKWLNETGKKLNTDYESLVENIVHKQSRMVPVTPRNQSKGVVSPSYAPGVSAAIEPIMFFNDVSLVTYIKLKWGGR